MPRKVFISFLGTSLYQECEYTKGDFSYKSRFIQEATFRYLSTIENWTETDRILVLLTKKAERVNWLDNNSVGTGDHEPGIKEGLRSVLERTDSLVKIDTIQDLPEGKDEEEIGSIFDKIYSYLQDGDSLYFDLTHAFRYLPMLILVLGNYAKFLKGVSIKSITYGNWEMSSHGTQPAPIIDLLSLSELQDWTFAAGQFIESGNADQLISLSKKEYIPILKDTSGQDESARKMRAFTESLAKVISERQSCRGLDIISGESINRVNTDFLNLNIDSSRPYAPIFSKIADTWMGFSKDYDVLNGIKAAQWCFDKGLFLQSATLLEETVLLFCSKALGLNPLSHDDQQIVSGAFDYAANSFSQRKKQDNYSEPTKQKGEVILNKWPGLVNPFQVLRENIRNDFNHAGIRRDPQKTNTIVSNLERQLAAISSILLNQPLKDSNNRSELYFINLSNHPTSDWKESQIIAAMKYGIVVDYPFPNVSSTYSEDDIRAICEQIVSSIILQFPQGSAIHIMGEMSLTYALVTELKSLGYICLTSTSERTVSTNEMGDKVAHFEFVQFRRY